jgi:hypothetical protein
VVEHDLDAALRSFRRTPLSTGPELLSLLVARRMLDLRQGDDAHAAAEERLDVPLEADGAPDDRA